MTRDIIEINEELCDGCGDCAIGCAEGAIRIIDGKARLVRAEFCDGFGDCVGECHTGALKVVRREAPAFDEEATIRNLLATEGIDAVRRYKEAQDRHAASEADAVMMTQSAGNAPRVHIPVIETTGLGHGAQNPRAQNGNGAQQADGARHADGAHAGHHHGGGCPGSMQRDLRRAQAPVQSSVQTPAGPGVRAGRQMTTDAAPVLIRSELGQWPVQLHLVQPGAPFFRNRELVVMSTCGPIASAEVHQRYLRDRSVVVACPKLDNTAPYVDKLAAIFTETTIPKVLVVIMEVPCCRGLTMSVRQAHAASGREDLIIEEHILSLEGAVKAVNVY